MKEWNKPNSSLQARPSRRRILLPMLSVVFVLLAVVGGVAWLMRGVRTTENGDEKSSRPVLIEDVKPQIATRDDSADKVVKVVDPHEGMVLSPAGVWQPTNRPWRANATKVHNVHTNWSHTASHKVPYKNAVEQMLLTTFSCPLGTCPPPYMRIPQKDKERLIDILIDKPVAEDDDTLDQIKNKEIIALAKQQMKEFIRKGGNPDSFFKAYHNQLQRAYELRSAAIRETSRIVTEEGDVGLAREFQDEMNRRFKKEGIRPIHIDID